MGLTDAVWSQMDPDFSAVLLVIGSVIAVIGAVYLAGRLYLTRADTHTNTVAQMESGLSEPRSDRMIHPIGMGLGLSCLVS